MVSFLLNWFIAVTRHLLTVYRYKADSLLITERFPVHISPVIAQQKNKAVDISVVEYTLSQPADISQASLLPGLAVIYYKKFFKRHLRYLPQGPSQKYPSFKGKPITDINHQFGKDNVFGSGESRGIGLRMTGYLHLAQVGVYEFQALSNDGLIVQIGGQVTLSDPDQHSDRLSNIGRVTVNNAGWYPIIVEYFQRKGTAALKLFWKIPGNGEFSPVSSKAYGHTE